MGSQRMRFEASAARRGGALPPLRELLEGLLEEGLQELILAALAALGALVAALRLHKLQDLVEASASHYAA
jgi:hypothetical protein